MACCSGLVDTAGVIVELRAVPDCPNLGATRAVLWACVAEAGLPLSVIVERVGDFPSPSVLVDGVDVTGADPYGPAACVLAPPTSDQIRTALAGTPAANSPLAVADADPGLTDCCGPAGDPIRADRPYRAARLPASVRQVHHRLLRHFATTGAPPTADELASMAADAGDTVGAALDRLAADDLIAVDEHGRLVAAYPFSPTPTDHVVNLGEIRVYAMCAIDALGIAPMLGVNATIRSHDPHTGAPVTVTFTAGAGAFRPATAVVVYAANAAGGRSVDTCCSTINFFAEARSAQAWIDTHRQLAATILDQPAALALGRDIFAPLLGPAPTDTP